MKWTLMVSTLVLGFSLTSQSFGFELLDRLLGTNGNVGCAEKCCEPKCAAPAPVCCDPAPTCCAKRPSLLSGLHSPKKYCPPPVDVCGCDHNGCADKVVGCCVKPDPKCGVDPCATACCKPRRPTLLDRIFACNRCKPSCCQPTCGCEVSHGGEAAPDMDHDMPPAPVVDPSAYVPAQRRVVHASSTSVR